MIRAALTGGLLRTKYSFRHTYWLAGVLLLLGGCAGSSVSRCSSSAEGRGYFCFQGYNFGKNLTHTYKQGVRDGCRTANGYFNKNYLLSGRSKDYLKGWNTGRATCKLIVPKEAEPGTMRTQYQQSIDAQKYYGN